MAYLYESRKASNSQFDKDLGVEVNKTCYISVDKHQKENHIKLLIGTIRQVFFSAFSTSSRIVKPPM